LLIIQTDGYGADGEIEAIGAAAKGAGGIVEYPDNAAGERYLWLRRHGRGYGADHWLIGEDVAVPRSALAAMLAAVEDIGRRRGLQVAVVAHAGDGNLHPLFSLPRQPADGAAPPQNLLDGADELVRAALGLGGTISGEHGVGITKRPWIAQELGEGNLALQRRLKAAFDPLGTLNPHTWLAQGAPTGHRSAPTAVPLSRRNPS
jgi:glycolate oxidase